MQGVIAPAKYFGLAWSSIDETTGRAGCRKNQLWRRILQNNDECVYGGREKGFSVE